MPKPWERLPEESEEAFGLFLQYRDLAYPDGIAVGARFVPRSLRKLAEAAECSYPSVCGLARKHGWAGRCVIYDQHVDELRLGARANELQRSTLAHSRILASVRAIAENEIAKHLERSQEDPSVAITSLKEASDLVEKLVKLDRLILGASTENVAGGPSQRPETERSKRWNLEALSLEQLEALETARALAGGAEPEPVPDKETRH